MIKRELYLRKLRPYINNKLIKIIVGIRRSGKSTLMSQIRDELLEDGITEKQIIYINFES